MTEALGAPENDPAALDAIVDAALAEDIGDGDRTTEWTVPPDAAGLARVIARAEGVLAGRRAGARVFERLDATLKQVWMCGDGDRLTDGDELLRLSGSLRSILMGERTALNFLGRLSGIATQAASFVAALEGTGCRVTDTRKTTPGWRALEKEAVAAGGAVNHRFGLYDMVLIKENHLRAVGGIRPALRAAKPRAETAGLRVSLEVTSLDELEEALDEGVDRVLLDNMTLEELAAAVRRVRALSRSRPTLEASGGVTLETAAAIARTGVDLVSVGAITHSAPALDLSLQVVA